MQKLESQLEKPGKTIQQKLESKHERSKDKIGMVRMLRKQEYPDFATLNAFSDAKYMYCFKAREWFLQATSCVFRPESILTPECYAFLWNLVL